MCCCYCCGKAIKGNAVQYVPPSYLVSLGLDFPRAYHPACYQKEQDEAGRELFPEAR